ncbi:MAG: tetratricopeptide repeat protein [Bryobacterales bacterium]|nr:tetratricopeptide repeat protein [Bryobacterales bacterium]
MNSHRLPVLTVLLLLNVAYVAAFPSATIFYVANVLLHLVLGVAFIAVLWRSRAATLRFSGAALTGLYLMVRGATIDQRWWLYAHALLGFAAMLWLWFALRKQAPHRGRAIPLCLVILALAAGSRFTPRRDPGPVNTGAAPVTMEGEGEGPGGHFWPSSARTNAGLVPSSYFMDSEHCGSCHKDVYEQWKGSMHHFASFNNQFYRKSIEYMQSVQGSTRQSRWCAGCHDHALLFNGRWEKPVKDQIDTPEAHIGLSCVSCHSIVKVHNTMGNAAFTLDYNWLHKIAASRNPYIQQFEKFVTYLNPEPHRRTFLKPLHRDSAEFCAACHKVHLDVPVNNYRWVRGFNDYDNWQASGVSGRGARSFYYPPKSLTCTNCHMPEVRSNDPGNRNGMVHNHRFPGANTAVPYVNEDEEQLAVTRKFLESGFITVDIFSASPVEASREMQMVRRASDAAPAALTTFAVGEEAETSGAAVLREVGRVAAPLDKAGVKFQPGETVRVDVVVRTKLIGHFFPGGTVDAFDIWLELEGNDATGRRIFASGSVENEGRGPVEKGAHFYRSLQLDGSGNPINKRNAWQTRSLLYVRMIPPGAADTAHFRVDIPKDAKGPITLKAKLNYRKFSWYYTQFAYAGEPKPGQDAGLVNSEHDSRVFSFEPANIPSNVSGRIKDRIPDLPITVLARAEAKLELAARGEKTEWKQAVRGEDYERWNDWGIGMLLQGDLKGAEYAFRKVMEAKPDYADGPLNVARALIREGETEAAKPLLKKAFSINSKLARVHFFQAMVEKSDGNYDAAIAHLKEAAAQYPEDRVVLNQLGRLYFLKRQYGEAARTLEGVLRIDPEDLQAHYSLMLCYRGLNDAAKAELHAKLFRRFKADEASQAITEKPRQLNPEDNNERQMIHDHESVPLKVSGT